MKSNCFKVGVLFLLISTGCSNDADRIFKMKEVSIETGTVSELHEEYVRGTNSLSNRILKRLCCCCVAEHSEHDLIDVNDNEGLEEGFNFTKCNFNSVASLLFYNSSCASIEYFYVKIEGEGNCDDDFIKICVSLIKEKDMTGIELMDIDLEESFSRVIQNAFIGKKYEFNVLLPLPLRDEKMKKYKGLKFILESKLRKFIDVEKKYWGKKLSCQILGHADFYPELPLIPKYHSGICSINPKKLLKDTHFCLLIPSVISGQFLTLDWLEVLIKRYLKNRGNQTNLQITGDCELQEKEFVVEQTIDDFDVNHRDYTIEQGCSNNISPAKSGVNSNAFVFSNEINRENIKAIIGDFILKNRSSWYLVSIELFDGKIREKSNIAGYSVPSLMEGVFMMLYAIENNIVSMLKNGIVTETLGEKYENVYLIKYKSDCNSIEICLRPIKSISKFFLLKKNCGESTLIETGYQRAFVNSDYYCQLCCCSNYCCHDNVLLENPFFCGCCNDFCKDRYSECNFFGLCLCPAINDCCIYPTSESWCERCRGISCKENCKCILASAACICVCCGLFLDVSLPFILAAIAK